MAELQELVYDGDDYAYKKVGESDTEYERRKAQYNVGYGDYTTEREALLDGISLNDVVSSVRELDKQYAKSQTKDKATTS